MTTSADDTLGLADGRAEPSPDQRVEKLQRQLRLERERALNATDRMLGAQAEAAQARAEVKELHHRLHVREAEVAQLHEQLAEARASSWSGLAASTERLARRAPSLAKRATGRVRRR